ncbi:MAG: response regulator [Planctomycetales bacterium]|nr:response regulator [Planctomycetales bacterium]
MEGKVTGATGNLPPAARPVPGETVPASPLGISPPRVLIVDESEDSREVLKTALQRRGLEILEADAADQGLALAQTHRPSVIVLDLEIAERAGRQLCHDFAQQAGPQPPSLVLIGSVRRSSHPPSEVAADEVFSKPYHYGPLIRRIEQLVT